MDHATVVHATATLTIRAPELALIPAFPLAAFGLLIFFGRRLGRLSAWVAVAALCVSALLTGSIASAIVQGHRLSVGWAWLSATNPMWSVGLAADGLTWVMLFVVTVIGTLIAIYSIGYMRDDPRFSRFFAYFSLFCASMLTLVLADHFVLLYAGWELVGLCSYLLIGFWFEKPAAAQASRKAFLTTRVGDTGLLLGIFCLAWMGGDLHFQQLGAAQAHLSAGWLTAISLLVFLGAAGKSAQIPLHVWLPDAMEGPTPVSALIHAATMVAAGVYLVARTFPLFTAQSLQVVFVIGLATHLFAGTVALTMTDLKRILAYSTLSQLGLMMTALGLGAPSVAMFHLLTHAFFKALLFLGAGSVIHATHQQELSHLGGLRRALPWTATLIVTASLAMAGFPFLSGFWSKDAILLVAHYGTGGATPATHRPWAMWVLLGGAVMTAAYIFRLYFRCFHGTESKAHGHHVESPRIMVAPMAVLAVGALAIGLVGAPWTGEPVFNLLGHLPSTIPHGLSYPLLLLSMLVFALGVALAWTVGVQRRNLLPSGLRPLGHRLYILAANKYYVDELYDRVLIQPFLRAAAWLARWDQQVIDGAVDGAGRLGAWVSVCKGWFDRVVVDGIVNGVALTIRGAGALARWLQTGIIQQYLLVVVVAVVVLSAIVRH